MRENKQQRAQAIVDRLAVSFGVSSARVQTNGELPRSVAGWYRRSVPRMRKAVDLARTRFVDYGPFPAVIEIRPRSDIDTLLHEFAHHLAAVRELAVADCHAYLFWQILNEVRVAYHQFADHVTLTDAY